MITGNFFRKQSCKNLEKNLESKPNFVSTWKVYKQTSVAEAESFESLIKLGTKCLETYNCDIVIHLQSYCILQCSFTNHKV